MSLDKDFFQKELDKRYEELETVNDEMDGLKSLIEAGELNKKRIAIETSLINEYINILSQEAIAEEAPAATE